MGACLDCCEGLGRLLDAGRCVRQPQAEINHAILLANVQDARLDGRPRLERSLHLQGAQVAQFFCMRTGLHATPVQFSLSLQETPDQFSLSLQESSSEQK